MLNTYASGYPIPGVDKHYGRHASYFSIQIGAVTKNFFAWTRISQTGSVDTRENTNPGSSLRTVQPMREEPPSFDIEVQLPFKEEDSALNAGDGAKSVVNFLRAGRVMNGFNVGTVVGGIGGVFQDGYLDAFGKWVIERSSIEISRDDFTTVRATVRALGYENAENLPIGPPTVVSGSFTPTPAP
jgi:hypothetical protein